MMSMSDSSLIFRTALMPASQAVAWYLVLRQRPLLAQVWKIALFYCIWALHNKYADGVTQELGQYSMGLLALAAYFNHRRASIAATVLVLINYLLALGIILSLTAHDMAMKSKNRDDWLGMTWAHTFQLYVLSNLALWTLVLVELMQQPTPLEYSVINGE
ncbi:hypothetical protein MPSEU_000933000 [Mayamaea pseudoterrestris]|nr:hypothetical protein MPSEU_000933000 [Mayamaea pseudoterrestris]